MKSEPMVFIVDDDESVRKSIARLVKSIGLNVETFPSPQSFLHKEPYNGPCCLVLDVRMPGMSGIDLQRELEKSGLFLPVIFITGYGTVPMSVQAMKNGAVDFLPKPFKDQDLLDAIQHALDKSAQTRKDAAEIESIQLRIDRLTHREYEVLSLIISGMLNKQVAFHLGISEKTVKVHRARVMEKIQVDSLAELVRLTEKIGITSPKV